MTMTPTASEKVKEICLTFGMYYTLNEDDLFMDESFDKWLLTPSGSRLVGELGEVRVGERILCAAIWYKDGEIHGHQPKNIETGYVLCGRRHNNIITIHGELTNKPTRRETSVQGFLTSLNRFLDRTSANEIAIDAGQVADNIKGDELISEDLY